MNRKQIQKDIDRKESIEVLRKSIDKEKGIAIIIKSVSSSGMSRRMNVYTKDLDQYLNFHVARVLGWPENDKGILVTGCGMDMAFHLAYTLTSYLYEPLERESLTGNGSGCLPWKTL